MLSKLTWAIPISLGDRLLSMLGQLRSFLMVLVLLGLGFFQAGLAPFLVLLRGLVRSKLLNWLYVLKHLRN